MSGYLLSLNESFDVARIYTEMETLSKAKQSSQRVWLLLTLKNMRLWTLSVLLH